MVEDLESRREKLELAKDTAAKRNRLTQERQALKDRFRDEQVWKPTTAAVRDTFVLAGCAVDADII